MTKLSFGEYIEIKEASGFKNSMKQRTIGALAMYPSGNTQGTWYFWSLESGKTVHRKQWEKLPITNEVIQRVNQLGADNSQRSTGGNFKYTKSPGLSYTNSDGDESDSNDSKSTNWEMDTIKSDGSVDNPTKSTREHEYQHSNNEDVEDRSVNSENNLNSSDDFEHNWEVDERIIDERIDDVGSSDQVLRPRNRRNGNSMYHKYEDTQLLQIEKQVITKLYNSITTKRHKGSPKKKKTKMLKVKQNEMFRKVLGTIMTQIAKASKHAQVNMKEGIKRYGEKAIEAVFKEYAQLDEKDTFKPEEPSRLTDSQKREALNLITIVKEKQCGKIKGRACADGR